MLKLPVGYRANNAAFLGQSWSRTDNNLHFSPNDWKTKTLNTALTYAYMIPTPLTMPCNDETIFAVVGIFVVYIQFFFGTATCARKQHNASYVIRAHPEEIHDRRWPQRHMSNTQASNAHLHASGTNRLSAMHWCYQTSIALSSYIAVISPEK